MNNKTKNAVVTLVIGVLFLALSIFCWVKAPDEFSYSERRTLAKFPEINAENIASGTAMSNFETYTLDQFPMRDTFRTVKALISRYALAQKENNDLYYTDGHIASLDYPLDTSSVLRAASRFEYVVSKYASASNNIYLSLIPDKNYFLADSNGYPSLDYSELTSLLLENCPSMKYIDIFPSLLYKQK